MVNKNPRGGKLALIASLSFLLISPIFSLDFHYSNYVEEPGKYLTPIRKYQKNILPQKISSEKIVAGIVPHHFLASDMTVGFFERISRSVKPKTIILIGPNHFKQGNNSISLSS